MRTWPLLLLFALAACRPSLKGWWDLEEWRIEREGADPLVETDAGIVVWQAEGSLAAFGSVYHSVRYDYDPVAFALVPDPDAELVATSWEFEEWDKDLPLEMDWIEGEEYFSLSFELSKFRTTSMTLESPSPFPGDAAIWTWNLVR